MKVIAPAEIKDNVFTEKISPNITILIYDDCEGLICKDGNKTHIAKFDSIGALANGCIRVRKNGKAFHVLPSGQRLYTNDFDFVSDYGTDNIAVASIDGEYGHIDKKGKWIYSPIYDHVDLFSKGLAMARLNGQSFHVNYNGKPAYKKRFFEVGDLCNRRFRINGKKIITCRAWVLPNKFSKYNYYIRKDGTIDHRLTKKRKAVSDLC